MRWFGYALSLLIHFGGFVILWRVAQVQSEFFFQVEQGLSSIQLTATFATTTSEQPIEVNMDRLSEPATSPVKTTEVKPAEIIVERVQSSPIPDSKNEIVVEQAITITQSKSTHRVVPPHPPPETTAFLPPLTRQQPKAIPIATPTVPLNSPQSTGSIWDLPPRPLPTNRAPLYPIQALSARQQGNVVLLVAVQSDGSVGKVEISTSSGFRVLDDAAIEAVRLWRFSAARQGTDLVSAEVFVPVIFQLK